MDTLNSSPQEIGRFQKIDKIMPLAQCSIFSGLSQWELKSISQLMRLVEYKKDEVIYREGGQAEAFYVVVSGRFEVSITSADKKKILAYLRRGDYFGEMSLLTDEPHSATLRALSDSLTLELKKEDFKKIVEHSAVIAVELSRRLSSRLKGIDPRSRFLLKSDVISIYGSRTRTGRTSFSINLAASLYQETQQRTVLLDMSPSGEEVSSRLQLAKKIPLSQFHGIESGPPDALSSFIARHPVGFEVLSVGHKESDALAERVVIPLLNHLAIDYRFILIDLPARLDEAVMKAFSQSDFIYLVTDSHLNNVTEAKEVMLEVEKDLSFPDEKIFIVVNEALFGIRTTTTIKKEIFGQKICYSLPATPGVGEHEKQGLNPFVVDEPSEEYSRIIRHIARRVSNNLVGLALGSGAALGLAHIGVLKILDRERIPVDMISGSSIGALIGSLYAVGKSAEEVEEAALSIKNKWRLAQLFDFSLFPIRGVIHGQGVIRHFKKYLGNKLFTDCRIPLKIVGANLSRRERVVFESGFILDAVRASISIPAIFKPVLMNKEVVVDGGILSPLPVQPLLEAGANKIIAVNVIPTAKDVLEKRLLLQEKGEEERQRVRQKNTVYRAWHRLRRKTESFFFPNIFDILMNTIQTMESEISEIEGESADVLIRPVVPVASWVEFYKAAHFVQRGEEEATRMLSKIKALVAQQGN